MAILMVKGNSLSAISLGIERDFDRENPEDDEEVDEEDFSVEEDLS